MTPWRYARAALWNSGGKAMVSPADDRLTRLPAAAGPGCSVNRVWCSLRLVLHRICGWSATRSARRLSSLRTGMPGLGLHAGL